MGSVGCLRQTKHTRDVLIVFSPELGAASISKRKFLLFGGSIASVAAFRVLSFMGFGELLNSLVKLLWLARFYNFLSLRRSVGRETDVCVASLFFSGWKLILFGSVCEVLGAQLDLRGAKLGWL